MAFFKKFKGKKKADNLEEIYGTLNQVKDKFLKIFTENLSDPDIKTRTDCSLFIMNEVLPIIKNQKQSFKRDNAIEKVIVLAKEMRVPVDELEKIALDSAAFYYVLHTMHENFGKSDSHR